ncbi:MAG: cyclic nucleotide-binding domain-containing protein [Turicibacter sp.]
MKRIYNADLLLTHVNHEKITHMFSKHLLQYFELFSFDKGDFLIRQGTCSHYLFFILRGKARVYAYTSSGNITLLSFCDGYEPLGDSASLWKKEAFANVEAITDGMCLGISLEKYRELLLADPVFLRHTCEKLANKLNESNAIFANVFLGSIEQRLAFYILHSSRQNVFSSNISECANIMRTSYRHLLRILNTFCQNGVLEKQGKDYVILDLYELNRIAFELE